MPPFALLSEGMCRFIGSLRLLLIPVASFPNRTRGDLHLHTFQLEEPFKTFQLEESIDIQAEVPL